MAVKGSSLPASLMRLRGREGTFKRQFIDALAGSTGIYLIGTFLGFLIGVQLARGLGIENYGIYGFCMAIASLGSTFASGGVQLLATRETSALLATEKLDELRDFLSWAFKIVLILSLAAALAAAFILIWLQGDSTTTAILVALTVPSLALVALVGAIMRGSGAIVAGQSLDTCLKPLFIALALAFWAAMGGSLLPSHALAIGVAGGLFAIMAGLPRIWHLLPQRMLVRRVTANTAPWRRAATTMGISTILRAADAALPLLILGTLAASAEAGAFRVAASAMVLVAMPGTIISIMVPAMAARLFTVGDHRRLALLASVVSVFAFVTTLILAVALYSFGEVLIIWLFGAEYHVAWKPLMILSVAAVVSATFGMNIALLHVSGNERLVTIAFGLALLLSAVAAPFVVPSFGAIGAAAVVLASVALRELILTAACLVKVRIDPSIFSTPFRIAARYMTNGRYL